MLVDACRRSYPAESTGSHPNSEVKLLRDRLVLRWGTTRESWLTATLFFFLPFSIDILITSAWDTILNWGAFGPHVRSVPVLRGALVYVVKHKMRFEGKTAEQRGSACMT